MEIKEFVLGLQHIGLPAKSIEETIRFYGELGFEVAWQTENGKCAFLKLQNIVIETYEGGEHAAQCYGAIDHIAIDVSDVDRVYALAQEKGYPVVSNGLETLPFWENGVKFFTIEGPNKEKVEFNQYL